MLVVADVCLQGHDPERADGQAELGGHQRIAAAFEELDHPVGFDLAFQVGAGAGAQQVQGHGAGPAFQSGGARRGEGCFGVHPDGAEEFPSGADGDHDTPVEPVFGHGWHEQRLVGFGEVREDAAFREGEPDGFGDAPAQDGAGPGTVGVGSHFVES